MTKNKIFNEKQKKVKFHKKVYANVKYYYLC